MRLKLTMIAMACLAAALSEAQPTAIDFDSVRWNILDPGGRLMPFLGRPSLYLERGLAVVNDADFGDGTLEFDVVLHGNPGFAGVAFRGESPDDFELIYLRTSRSRGWDALQYTPFFHGQEAWQLYVGAGYNGVAELPANRWVHVRLVASGYTARLYVDNAAEPQLVVTDLKRPWRRGFVGLWGRSGAANFSNVRIAAETTSSTAQRSVADASPGTIVSWMLSPAVATSVERADKLRGDLDESQWLRVPAEPSGIVNIAQYRAKSTGVARNTRQSGRDTVYARSRLIAAASTRVRLTFGYSDEVTVFLNGRPLFFGNAGYLTRDGSYLGTMTLGADTLVLDLTPGPNELVFAVTESFGGWGLAARLDSADRVTIEP